MLKKIFLTTAISILTTGVATANLAPYVGGGLGVTINTSSHNNSNPSLETSVFRGVPFNVVAGYGGVINDSFYVAGEAFGTVWTAEISDHNLKSTYGYGVSLLPGMLLSDHTIAFARVGVIRTHFVDETKTGGQVGLGMQAGLTQNVDVRGEYDFSAYGSFKHHGFDKQPRTDTFNVSAIYKFE